MINVLKIGTKHDRDRFSIPRSVQRSIPIREVFQDGIWRVSGKYSRTWRFSDINYAVASLEDQKELFTGWCGVLNALPTDALAKLTIFNRRMNPKEFEAALMIHPRSDRLDGYRAEYNNMLLGKANEAGNIMQDKLLTVSTVKKNSADAHAYFSRVESDLAAGFGRLSSSIGALDCTERLRVLHDFFRVGEEQGYQFDLKASLRRGGGFRDYICSDGFRFRAGYFEMGKKVGRVLFLKDFASFISDQLIKELTSLSRSLMLSIDILPVPTDEAVRDITNRLLAVETDITRWQSKQNQNLNFSATPPQQLTMQQQESREFLEDLTTHDQRMMFANLTLVHLADDLDSLDADTETLCSIARQRSCQLAVMRYQQEDAFNTVLPYGLRRIDALRTLTTEGVAALMPFTTQEIQEAGGVFYGQNAISKNLIVCNRKHLLNGNGFILGVSGSGKSFAAKEEIASIILSTNDDVFIVDPEREYGPLVRAMGGEVVDISPNSRNHINALDMARDCSEGENPVTMKSEFLMSLCEQIIGAGKVGAKEKSLIDRCAANVYRPYLQGLTDTPPTLRDFHAELSRQDSMEARDLALAIELYTNGSFNVFAEQTNVDMDNRIVVFDILDLGKNMKTAGMLVTLDAIQNRVMVNRQKGRYTHVFIDEIYLFFQSEFSSIFLSESWKRFRKYGALATGITQNVSDCLQSHMARTMLANSEFLLMLNQAPTDRIELAKLLNISKTQLNHITNAEAGHGLVKVGGALVPFVNHFPRGTDLYRLMTTKPGENG